ncbi:MAG: Gfo/Idh/MocA family oxidoreductase [Verrucomicrobia bacterium]|nr:Gfo/Idh/MocA family oxidoreductase [Verrucomicrobiota bacterium]
MTTQLNRRHFLQASSLAATGLFADPRFSIAQTKSPNEKLNIACIGVGNRGAANIRAVSGENIIALCDVDERQARRMWETFPRAKRYADFRKMLEAMDREIDAVVVSTPDHTHASAALLALQLGKHVYCEKPLAHNVRECRLVTELARKKKVATQLGNQLHASFQVHRAAELIQAGLIGKVSEVHCASERLTPSEFVFPKPWASPVTQESGRPKETPPVPPGLDWDLWLGPARERPYHPAYCPAAWRMWRDFGTGGLGDMGCHIMDPAFLALGLKYPISVEAAGPPVPYEKVPMRSGVSVRYIFPARGEQPPVTLYWHGAGSGPSAELLEGKTGTCLFVGEKGQLLCQHHPPRRNDEPQLLPIAKFKDVELPPSRFANLRASGLSPADIERPHHENWLIGCKTGVSPACHFPTFGGPLAETALLGHVAFWAGQKIAWDGEKMRITNCPEAEKSLRREYRKGWEL